MKTKQPSPQHSAVSIRQQRYRQRMEELGFRRTTLWLHQESEHLGYKHGHEGGKLLPVPVGLNAVSFCNGWFRGAGDQEMPIFCTCCQNQMGHGSARDYYDLFTLRPYELICEECEKLIEAEKMACDTPH
ncbi:hypothetical protein IMW75_19995 [Pseudomonas gregormendelii]|uniref:Uncharacterized protein n=1 Tax=Pseudomonas gregormendelii TaxID=1628277 RepID=A0ABS3AKM4_9PSED|nr:hypothetical protein [Pseudomonas gregormendelii]MBN3967545.1 hypothetical protein [Pseudomonas gregormendelii]